VSLPWFGDSKQVFDLVFLPPDSLPSLRAKRSNPEPQTRLDCFVASAPRNDGLETGRSGVLRRTRFWRIRTNVLPPSSFRQPDSLVEPAKYAPNHPISPCFSLKSRYIRPHLTRKHGCHRPSGGNRAASRYGLRLALLTRFRRNQPEN
jgi:hypothetical protein